MGYRRQFAIAVHEDGTGDQLGVWGDGIFLKYEKIYNDIGLATWAVPPDHDVLDLISDGDRVTISLTRGTSSGHFLGWNDDFIGSYRESQYATDQVGNEYVVLYIPSGEELIARNIIAYRAGVTDRSEWSSRSAGTIVDDIWRYNLTTSAASPDRVRLSGNNHLPTPSGIGTTNTALIDYRAAWKNCLTAMRELFNASGDKFEVIDSNSDPTNYLFGFLTTGQPSLDVSDDIIFGLPFTNVSSTSFREGKLNEKTVAIVGGQGEEDDRNVVVRTGANFNSTTNDTEVFYNQRDTDDTSILQDRGDVVLAAKQAKSSITADIMIQHGYDYMDDYSLGSIVSFYTAGQMLEKQITSVRVAFDPDMTIKMKLEDKIAQ